MSLKFLLPGLFLFAGFALAGQKGTIRGTVTDAENGTPVADASVVVQKTGLVAATDAAGKYVIKDVPPGEYTVVVSHAGFVPHEQLAKVKKGVRTLVDVTLKHDPNAGNATNIPSPVTEAIANTEIPTVTLEDADSETDGSGEVANLLGASRDVFQQISGFGWNVFRFRDRGYDGEHTPTFINGIQMNDPETGIFFFGEVGGLNDVLRNRENVIGLDVSEFAYGGLGGAQRIDTRASTQRKQIRASYAITNRNYRNRVMLTANTGLMPGGWAVSASVSHRWATEGYVPGTWFDGYGYFLSVDKKFNQKHALNLTVLGTPVKGGRTADTFQEMFDISGSNYYNPLWGYQDGQKRNSDVAKQNSPIAILRYDWTPGRKTTLTFSTYGQLTKYSRTRMEWGNAGNPAPDYNRRLPSSLSDSTQAAGWWQMLANDESLRQLNWDAFFDANRNNTETVKNAEGIADNNVTGLRSVYILEERHSDAEEFGFNLLARRTLSTRATLNGGANYTWYRGLNYRTVNDLLGGEFWLDVNKFAATDFPDDPDASQFDLLHPNNLVREGERFGHDYDENIRTAGLWATTEIALKHWQFFAGAELGQTSFWRTGNMQHGVFKNNSLGDSEKLNYRTWSAKAGVVYKINGRNYLYVNGLNGTKAPQFRDLFIAPRVRNDFFPDVKPFEMRSIEGGYHLRAPYYRARVTGYLTDFIGETETYQVFFQSAGEFGTYHLENQNRRHTGIEAAIEAKPLPAWTLSAAASIGKYYYTNRPSLDFVVDNFNDLFVDGDTVYQKNFYVPRVPQMAATFGIRYESKRFWFATLSLNWRDGFWYDFDEARRTRRTVEGIERGSEVWRRHIDQQQAPAAYTLDFFGGKSIRLDRNYFININIGVNNLLDNQDIIISGRDAYLRAYRDVNDIRKYSNEIQYAFGRNYFVSLVFRRQ